MLHAPPDWATLARPGRRIGHGVEAHARIGSTSDRARALLDEPGGVGRVVVADEQTAGRGRRGRGWLTPPGASLAMSVALRPALAARDAWQLGLAVALASRDACAAYAPVGLKWPNDLVALADGRKLGGLLVETALDGERLAHAVIGVGINVTWARAQMPAEIVESATSLSELAAGPVDRRALLGTLLDRLEDELTAVERGVSPLARYRAACVTIGASVVVQTPDEAVTGRAVGLDDIGALLVEDADGVTHSLASGEVLRVRGKAQP